MADNIQLETFRLWENGAPLADTKVPTVTFYPTYQKVSNAAVVIFPGGGYTWCAPHEGGGYAYLISTLGINAFVVDYRVAPASFPCPLLDARRAVRFVRANAEKFGIDKDKVIVMGSSAGGHLAALLSTFRGGIDGEGVDEVDNEDYLPSAQVLCYPVISSDEAISHHGSYHNLLGDLYAKREAYDPSLLADEKTPPAFIWHTAEDACVPVMNSILYAQALAAYKKFFAVHIYSFGYHGLSTADGLACWPLDEAQKATHNWLRDAKDWLNATFYDL